MFALPQIELRKQSKHSDRSTRATGKFNRRDNQPRAAFRKPAQVCQIFEMIKPRAQRQMVHRKILRRAKIDTHCVTSQAVHASLNTFLDGFNRKTGKMHPAGRVLIAIKLRVWPARRPAGAQKHDCAFRNAAVAHFPIVEQTLRSPIVRIRGSFGPYINHDGHAEELFCRNLVNGALARREMNWGVKVSAVMLKHPEAAREEAVFSKLALGSDSNQRASPGQGTN